MARLRILLTLIYVASAQSQLLPLDLASLTAGLIPGSGGAEHRSILNTLDGILNAGFSTVGGIGHTLLGLRQPQSEESNEEPNPDAGGVVSPTANPQYIGNPPSVLNHQIPNQGRNGLQQPYGHNSYPQPHNGRPTKVPIDHVPGKVNPAESLAENNGETDDNVKPLVGDRDPSGNPNETPISADGQGSIVRLPESNGKYNNGNNVLQNQNGGITKPLDLNNQQFIVVQPGGTQPNNQNGVYYIPSTNLGNQGISVVPNFNTPTTYTDGQGRVYYIIQPNVNQPTQPPTLQNPSVNQVYALMTINGQQALVPINNLPVNGLQVAAPQIPPGNQQPRYIVIPNNGQYVIQDPVTSRPSVNTVVNYVTNAPYHNAVVSTGPSDNNGSVPKSSPDSNVRNTKDVTLDAQDETVDKPDKDTAEKDVNDAKV